MDNLETYSLIDFMPMEPEVYFRLFVRLNDVVWPFQISAFAFGLAAIWYAWRGRSWIAGLVSGVGWIGSGVAFHLHMFAELNWAAVYTGWAFILQGVSMTLAGFAGALQRVPRRGSTLSGSTLSGSTLSQRAGVALAVFGLVIYPCLGPLTNRTWSGVEVFGIAPDPTAFVTLGLLLIAQRLPWLLALIPILWCALSGAIWYAMTWSPGLVLPVAALVFLSFSIVKLIQSRADKR